MRDLHGKIFANYRRWCRHVNVQRFTAEGMAGTGGLQPDRNFLPTLRSMRTSAAFADTSGGGGGVRSLPLSALSGDVWEFRGVWAFESSEAELHWVTNAELHQLMLWYLIWGEAANLRLTPECLCLILYCASNALQLTATVGWPVATLVEEAAAEAASAAATASISSIDSYLSHQSSSRAAGFPEGDFLASVVTPIYNFLKREVRAHSKPKPKPKPKPELDPHPNLGPNPGPDQVSERAKDDVSSRVMYDDVNESFWSTATVHALLPRGCGHVPMPEIKISCAPPTTPPTTPFTTLPYYAPYYIPLLHPSSPAKSRASRLLYPLTTSTSTSTPTPPDSICTPSLRPHPIRCEPLATRTAYAHLRRKLGEVPEKPARPLAQYLRKTYRETNGWLHLFQMFYRVYVFHAVLLHLTFCVAYVGWDWCAAEMPATFGAHASPLSPPTLTPTLSPPPLSPTLACTLPLPHPLPLTSTPALSFTAARSVLTLALTRRTLALTLIRSVLSTWIITHALLKATRQAIFMLLMWPLKKEGATGAPAEQRHNSNNNSAKPGSHHHHGLGRARSFRAFLLFGLLRIFCFLLVPAAFVAEWVGWYSSAAQACPEGIS